MSGRRRKLWGWGYEDLQASPEEVGQIAAGAREHLGFGPAEVERPPRLEDIELPAPRLEPPAALSAICGTDTYERATHAYGKAYRDLVRALRGRFDHPPDVVAHPNDERDLEQLLDWCAEASAAAIPFGGGTSVVGGVEPRLDAGYAGAVTIDLGRMDRVLDVDPVSRAARIQAGATGPRLEEQLKAHGLTLRHYPQSFEYSTLGGWIATRAGGHFATLHTHIDDFVESVRALTPRGVWESRRLPGSGAGPSPDRMLIGSEGILGVITEAWVRVQEAPRFKESAALLFDGFEQGAEAVRALAQSRLYPSNCRLLDPGEAALTGAAPDGKALLVLGFEAASDPVDAWMARALELCRDHGGEAREKRGESEGAWRDAFLAAPYLRDTLIAAGILAETFETAITWDRFGEFVGEVRERAAAALGPDGRITVRITHAYPDGAAPYFTVLAPARRGSELEQWDELKAAASDAIESAGGTITHHHAVGRDHRPWYDRQRPDLFADALRAAKSAVDPQGILNPGVLVDP
ncbi:MAG: alkyldihydroxyacetonephosphate synthase [Thermoleophilaceae bacterium]|jgi:alkyldihydroxyacetonephosphate synthase|nr:alkyldihydroxyacetonephosphate synthase [Thermoleophilaceae bacterium]